MILKTFQWNIGGGKARKPDDDPSDPLAYRNDALDLIVEIMRPYSPDIITLQESHSDNKNSNQAEKIAGELELPFFVNDMYVPSHLEEGQGLSQSVISRHPIKKHTFTSFLNPKLETAGPRGDRLVSHDKGVTSCNINLPDGLTINVKTSHSLPFRKYKLDPLSGSISSVRTDMMQKLKPETKVYLYQGDLNYDEASARPFLPDLFSDQVEEVILDNPTTPKGRRYDHVLYRGMKHIKSAVISDVLTDHFPIYSEFEI